MTDSSACRMPPQDQTPVALRSLRLATAPRCPLGRFDLSLSYSCSTLALDRFIRTVAFVILLGVACASGPVRHGLVPETWRQLEMTTEDGRACSNSLTLLGYLEGTRASDEIVAARREALRRCVNGNRDGIDPALWIDAVEGYLCSLARERDRLVKRVEREKAKTALVGSAAPDAMYTLGEEAMQVSEETTRMDSVLRRFERDAGDVPLAVRAANTRKRPECSGATEALADCVAINWSRLYNRLLFDPYGACAAPAAQHRALEQLLFGAREK